MAPGHDTPDRVEAGFERYRVMFLREWAREDPKRAAELAQAAKDPVRRRAAVALVLPDYAKVEPGEAETLRREIMSRGLAAQTTDDLAFLVALARAHFALGHLEDGESAVGAALKLGEQLASQRDRDRPV